MRRNIIEEKIFIEPFDLYLLLKEDYSILLESNHFHKDFGRFSFIFLKPKEIFICKDEDNVDEFLCRLSIEIEKRKVENNNLMFQGGFAGFLSYDFGVDLFQIPRKRNPNSIKAFFGYYDSFIIFDHLNKRILFSQEIHKDLKKAMDYSYYREYKFKENILKGFFTNFQKDEYMEAIRRIKKYIYEGDVYQVNLSQRFYFEGKFDPYLIYSILRKKNYGAFHAFIQLKDTYIISTSPELFLYKKGNRITTRPIKGTIKRGDNKEEDQKNKCILRNDPKCQSELLMIVDLERNDLAKICTPQSIEVKKLFEVEEYSSVYHLVSTIHGTLKRDVNFKDIIKATFPGGSITGAPKLSAMKIIEELEKDPRGVYTGSIGFISNNFNMAFNIAIRTLIIDKEIAYYNVGGGIVWDSKEEDEYEETLAKGKPLLDVLLSYQNSLIRR